MKFVHHSSSEVSDRIHVLQSRWENYVSEGTFDCFIEFTVAVNCLVEHFNRLRLPGLIRVCEGLEKTALACLGSPTSHPISQQQIAALQRQVNALHGAIASSHPSQPLS